MKGEEEGVEVWAVDDRQPHVQQEEAEVSVILKTQNFIEENKRAGPLDRIQKTE